MPDLNYPVVVVSLLGALASIPVYIDKRSLFHLYAIIGMQVLAAFVVAYIVPNEVTTPACILLLIHHAIYPLAWGVGETAEVVRKKITLKQLEKLWPRAD